MAREKKKSLGMLFEDTEHEIKDKQHFVEQQIERMRNMHEVLTELVEYKIVLEKANLIIHGENSALRNLNESLHSEGNLEGRFSISGRRSIDWENQYES